MVQQQRYPEALKTLQQCLERDGRNSEAYKLVAVSAIQMNRLDIAEPALRSAAQLSPNDYLVQFHLGALHYTESLFLAARPELERAIELKPDYVPAHLFLGLTLEEIADQQTAVETYRRSIALAEEQNAAADTAYLYLGRYLYRLNRFDESLPLLEKAAGIKPESAEVLLALGKTLHALKRNGEAIATLKGSAAANSQDPEPHYFLFRIFAGEHREDDAKAELARFEQLKQAAGSDSGRRLLQDSAGMGTDPAR